MKKFNSKRIILIGMFLGILFSLATYQNFSHNIEEITEVQELKSSILIENNVTVILENINNLVKNTIKISIDNQGLNRIRKNDKKEIVVLSSEILKRIESYYAVSSMYFKFADKNILLKIKETINKEIKFNDDESKFDACFAIQDNESFYKITYPIFYENTYIGLFEIRLDNKQILESIKKHINAEMAIFVNKNNILDNDFLANNYSFGEYIIADSTNKLFIEPILKNKNFSIEDNEEIFSVNNRLIEIDSITLSIKNEDKILVLFHDVTELYENIEEVRYDFLLYFIILLLIFLLISYYIYYNSKQIIIKQYDEIILKKEESEKLLKVKTEFLANMSHEIRTPLNAINGFIGLIEDQNNDKKISKYIGIIQDSSKNLLNIIEDILDLSKIESGKISINKIDFDSTVEFKLITHLFNTKLSDKKIDFNLNISKNVPAFLYSDILRIKQVIANLMDNAIKFTEEGKKIRMDISYSSSNLKISIQDEGIGISKERQQQIFKPFTQADSSTTRKYGGTGLGLTISSQLIELLGGKLLLDSEIDKGSRFYFSIPISIGKEIIYETKIEEKIGFNDTKILLVEDNLSNQLFMKVILKKLELEYDIASDGIEAISLFNKYKYDIILMDENMPNMSGIEATKKIRKLELKQNLKYTPVIALTANALSGDKEKFLSAGMDEYLTKPLNQEKFVKTLSLYLN